MSFKTIALSLATAAAFSLPAASAQAAPALKGKIVIERSGDAQLIKVARRGNLRTPGINRRLANQQLRIRNGFRSGRLTFGEARRVRKGVKRVRNALRRARFDGHVSRFERRRLHNMLDRNGRKIRRLANNGRFARGLRRKPGASIHLSF